MIRFLPYHQDQYFINLARTVWGKYEPRFDYDGLRREKSADAEISRLDRFSKGADGAVQRFRLKKALHKKKGR